MQKIIIFASILIFATMAAAHYQFYDHYEEVSSLWNAWKEQHEKTYLFGEEEPRFGIFADNWRKIQKLNKKYPEAEFGLNKFADLTAEEFKNQNSRCTYFEDNEEFVKANTIDLNEDDCDLPESVDWREKNAVTPVKFQKQCGSCWSFSTTGVLEGHYAIENGKLLSFAEQQLVDCDKKDKGCHGGLPYQALEYTAENGVELESDYPYTALEHSCNANKNKAIKVNTGYAFVKPKNAQALKCALTKSPVSIAIEADEEMFQLYRTGVITRDCGGALDHAVLAVGYTTVDGVEAFIVKNSWDSNWGNEGYVYISTNGDENDGLGVCGILGQPVIVQ